MLVYGSSSVDEAPSRILDRVATRLAQSEGTRGHVRHDDLVAALLDAGALAQGLLDRGFEERGDVDDLDPVGDAALDLATAIADAVASSWDGCARVASTREQEALRRLAGFPLPDVVTVREPEGFAHYAVYPEAFMAAAREVAPGPACVIGIRTIGTTLGAAVAASLDDVAALLTLRPVGHPFRRECSVSPALRAAIAACKAERYLVVDEGPGLSGSSIAAVVRLLAELGVPGDRITILSSHASAPGPEGDPETRAIWDRTNRLARTLDDLAGPTGPGTLAGWFEPETGPLREAPVDLSAGRWRAALGIDPARRPPVLAWQERRKLLLRGSAGTFVARFAGLGRSGDRKLAVGRALAADGFVAEPIALRHGFLLEPWYEDARPLDLAGSRDRLAEHVGRYLAARSRLGLAGAAPGASAHALFAMLRRNAAEAFGEGSEQAVERWRGDLDRLEAMRVPVATDNRLHLWEWLDLDGRILKADALDHHAGHDLIGCQDIAWDIAGATLELALDDDGLARLLDALVRAGVRTPPHDLIHFMLSCYAAFHCGYYGLASRPAGEDQDGLSAMYVRYNTILVECLNGNRGF